jgi:hypothetical protein
MKKLFLVAVSILAIHTLAVAQGIVPRVHNKITADDKGRLVIKDSTTTYIAVDEKPTYTLSQVKGNPKGDVKGIAFYFGNNLKGYLYYGFIAYGDSKHPLPVYFKETAPIINGEALINIKDKLSGKYDMIGWEKSGMGTLGYRVVAENGQILYDGKVSFSGKGPFKVAPTITEGPLVNLISHTGGVISFETNEAIIAKITANGKTFTDSKATRNHEIELKGLKADTTYNYTVYYGQMQQTFTITTAPKPGSRNYFIFSFAGDARNANGGGERNVYGTNAYMMKKMMAMNTHKGIAFSQFSGNVIEGNLQNKEEIDLQYANWKHAVEPFAHYFPIYNGMGNHEALSSVFATGDKTISVDKFPYATQSAEAAFATNFVHPTNGPASEDGASYDPDPKTQDFPPYNENVYYYTYDNVGMVVLNTDYWYAQNPDLVNVSSGNIHGYIMDKQLEWFEKTLKILEEDSTVDHVFVTLHSPLFPNDDHVNDAMWYNGSNQPRPYIRGNAVEKGIIERRNHLLDLMANKSTKVLAMLTGDENNYCRTEIGPTTPIYPDGWVLERNRPQRVIYQISNGAAGASYCAQEKTPWIGFTSGFTTQNTVLYFHIEGKSVEVEVINPDTMEEIETYTLR